MMYLFVRELNCNDGFVCDLALLSYFTFQTVVYSDVTICVTYYKYMFLHMVNYFKKLTCWAEKLRDVIFALILSDSEVIRARHVAF